MRCLWLARAIPLPLNSGENTYTARLAQALVAAGASVTFMGLAASPVSSLAAAETFEQALSLAREVRIGIFIAGALYGLAQVADVQGHVDTARRLAKASLQQCDAEDQERAREVAQWLARLPTQRPIRQAVN